MRQWTDLRLKSKYEDQELAADGRPAGVEADEEEELEPFDPEKISIDTKVVSMDTVIRRLLQDTIRLAPAFQRGAIWDSTRKSQLIESMMLKIPLPMFYVAADEQANWDVVDGLQRLTTIKEFILGNEYIKMKEPELRGEGFQLKGLEFWANQYDGCTFNQLPTLLSNRILETEFRFTVINPGTPEKVKRNVFKRINTGGMPLTAQEIRHALYQGHVTTLLKTLVDSTAFKQATSDSINDSRMAGRELILRFLAFSVHRYQTYPRTSDMDTFLSSTMQLINIMPALPGTELQKIFKESELPSLPLRFTQIEDLKERFEKGMNRAFQLFGNHTFRKSYGNKRRTPVNKTLFEVWGNLLADLSLINFKILKRNKKQFLREYYQKLEDEDFSDMISRHNSRKSAVTDRYKILTEIVTKYST